MTDLQVKDKQADEGKPVMDVFETRNLSNWKENKSYKPTEKKQGRNKSTRNILGKIFKIISW